MRIALAALLLASCGGQGPLFVDKRFSPEEEEQIQHSADLWTEAGAPIDLIFRSSTKLGRNRIVRANIDEMTACRAKEDDRLIGCTYEHPFEFGITIFIIPDRVDTRHYALFQPLTHEMGHFLNLRHIPEQDAIMHSAMSEKTATELTPADLRELHRALVCTREPRGCQR